MASSPTDFPALGALELASIACGIQTGDAMVKRAPLRMLRAGTVHPGKYLILVGGEVASVEEAMAAGHEVAKDLVDTLFLPDIDRRVVEALAEPHPAAEGEALGVLETRTVVSLLRAADRGVKGADVHLAAVRLADGLGGKAYCLFRGAVSDVEAALELAVESLPREDLLLGTSLIPNLHPEMLASLQSSCELLPHFRSPRGA